MKMCHKVAYAVLRSLTYNSAKLIEFSHFRKTNKFYKSQKLLSIRLLEWFPYQNTFYRARFSYPPLDKRKFGNIEN